MSHIKVTVKRNNIQSDQLKTVFKNSNRILAQKQPKSLLRLLSKAIFNTDTNNFIQPKGLFKCTDKRCKIYSLYVNEDNSFVMSNNMRWELRSHVTYRDINVIYYLKCSMCDHKEMYAGKTVGDNVVAFECRINEDISDVHVYHCAMKNKCLKEPYFQLNIMMKLKDSRQLEFYENHFHKKGYDTINCPEYLKNT